MPEATTSQEQKILENVANPVQSYEVDGEKTTMKDPVKQLEALKLARGMSAARNPLGAIVAFEMPSGSGMR